MNRIYIAFGASLGASGLIFILNIYLGNILDSNEFGLIGYFQTLCAIFLIVSGLGLNSYIVALRASKSNLVEEVNGNNALSLIITIVVGAIIAFYWLLNPNNISNYLVFLLAAFTSCAQAIYLNAQSVTQFSKNDWVYPLFKLFFSVILLVATLICLELSKTWVSFAVGAFIAYISPIFLIKEVRGCISVRFFDVKARLSYAAKILPHLISGWVVSNFDKVILGQMQLFSDLGTYFFAQSIVSIIVLLQANYSSAGAKRQLELIQAGRRSEIIDGNLKFGLLCLATAVATFFTFWISYQLFGFGEKYEHIVLLVGLLAFARLIETPYYMICNFYFFNGKTSLLSVVSTSIAIVSAICAMYFVPRFQLFGAIICAYIVSALNGSLYLAIYKLKVKNA